jgi:hypothetical protein
MKSIISMLVLSIVGMTMLGGCATAPPAPPTPDDGFTANDMAQQMLVNVPLTTPTGDVIITFDSNAMPVAIQIINPSPEVQNLTLQNGQANITVVLPPDLPVAPNQTVNITLVPVSTTMNPDGTIVIDFRGTSPEFPQIDHFTLRISGPSDMGNPPMLTANPTVTVIATITTLFGPLDFTVFSVPAEELLGTGTGTGDNTGGTPAQ